MKKKLLLLHLLTAAFFATAQNVGIGTTTPVQKLHVEGTTYLNGNVGISDSTPAFPLSFAPILGDKISLWSNSSNSYGFGIQGGILQIHTDISAADIAFGYGSSSSFTETMRIKGNGVLSFGGNAGIAGQALLSNGSASSPQWGYANSHTIGESFDGGIVFYVYDNGQHGLIAATADQSTGIQWSNGTNFLCNAVRNDGISTGRINTDSIIAKHGAGNYAAAICAKYLGGGFGDWYLPSKYELNLLYLQKAVVGGFSSVNYWSSSEYDGNVAWSQNFSTGNQLNFLKDNTFRVRAVRTF